MAHFRATIQGERGEASRLGNKRTGMTVTCNSWTVGVYAKAYHEDGVDKIAVYSTAGSNGDEPERLIAVVARKPGGNVETVTDKEKFGTIL